jgi:cytoskeletal protein CcmA (bactofilin family)
MASAAAIKSADVRGTLTMNGGSVSGDVQVGGSFTLSGGNVGGTVTVSQYGRFTITSGTVGSVRNSHGTIGLPPTRPVTVTYTYP